MRIPLLCLGLGLTLSVISSALNGALAAGIDPGTAHRIGDMAVRDMMAGQGDPSLTSW